MCMEIFETAASLSHSFQTGVRMFKDDSGMFTAKAYVCDLGQSVRVQWEGAGLALEYDANYSRPYFMGENTPQGKVEALMLEVLEKVKDICKIK